MKISLEANIELQDIYFYEFIVFPYKEGFYKAQCKLFPNVEIIDTNLNNLKRRTEQWVLENGIFPEPVPILSGHNKTSFVVYVGKFLVEYAPVDCVLQRLRGSTVKGTLQKFNVVGVDRSININ